MNKVEVLVEGYVKGERASGTVTLVTTTTGQLILVDAGDPWNGDVLGKALVQRGWTPDQVTDVVITHGHIDHCGNVSMFKRARHFMDGDWTKDGVYGQREEPRHYLCEDVWIEQRAGHTHSDLIVVVGTSGEDGERVTVVAGDLFEDEDDELKWRANSKLSREQEESREYVRRIADWIVPGHGCAFRVQK